MSKLTDKATDLAVKAKDAAKVLARDASRTVKEAAEDANEKRVIRQAKKKRAAAKNTALLALADVSKDLETYNESLTSSEEVKKATEEIIEELTKMRDIINKMTPESLVPILEEQKAKWLDEASIVVEGENFAQIELDRSEIIKRRKLATKQLGKAIEALKKRAEEEGYLEAN
jgi:hypothetical protein